MPKEKLSAREAALIAAARAALEEKPPGAGQAARSKLEPAAPAAPPQPSQSVAASAAPGLAPVERASALMLAARAEGERKRRRLRRTAVGIPLGIFSAAAVWVLFWMWTHL